jgi:hypothetical protein
MTYEVLWHARAVRQLLDLHWNQGSFVDAAVLRYAASGEGVVRKVATADGDELRLHAGSFYVRFSLDRTARTLTVWAVRRTPSK